MKLSSCSLWLTSSSKLSISQCKIVTSLCNSINFFEPYERIMLFYTRICVSYQSFWYYLIILYCLIKLIFLRSSSEQMQLNQSNIMKKVTIKWSLDCEGEIMSYFEIVTLCMQKPYITKIIAMIGNTCVNLNATNIRIEK